MKKNPSTGLVLIPLLSLPLLMVCFIGILFAGIGGLQTGFNQQKQTTAATADAIIAVQSQNRRSAFSTQVAEQASVVSYSRDISPLLQLRCVYCHGPESIAGAPPNGLELNTYDNVMRGSLFLPVIVKGEPENSSIILLLKSGGMPAQSDPLPPEQIQMIAEWIKQGAQNN